MRVLPIFASCLLAVTAGLVACDKEAGKTPDNLPWQISTSAEGYTQVFHWEIGKTTLKELINSLQHFPELAVFVTAPGDSMLEAYFGRRRLGLFEARLIAELDASEQQLQKFADEQIERKPQRSGAWKLSLSEDNVKIANTLPIKYLIYIPVADYTADIIIKHFGEPQDKVAVTDKTTYWFYPDKGLVLLLNDDGRDVFHYSAVKDYAALKQRLLKQGAGEIR
ncbi:MAG: hypothetical protein CR991_07525 [Proteobacteria bacterium]|nr:MAG: hypothetical protein CR991_07525 [Pseudomonadota bacterium]